MKDERVTVIDITLSLDETEQVKKNAHMILEMELGTQKYRL